MTGAQLLSVQDLSVTFFGARTLQALHGVNLELAQGETLGRDFADVTGWDIRRRHSPQNAVVVGMRGIRSRHRDDTGFGEQFR